MGQLFVMSRAMSGEQDDDYVKALDTCQSIEDVRALVAAYAAVAVDAVPQADAMKDFAEFRKGLRSERRGKFAGEAWVKKYGAILMPFPMLRISQVKNDYKVPFGVAWQRLKDVRPDLLELPA